MSAADTLADSAYTQVGYTPAGLVFEEKAHRYRVDGRECLGVTAVLRAAGLVDATYYTEAACVRGTLVHAAIALMAAGGTVGPLEDPRVDPYLDAYRRFLADAGFVVEACEERLADPAIGCAGTLDLRGRFVGAARDAGRIDVVDVKTGAMPSWVGYQTAAYVRMLPAEVRRRGRRWCLHLRADGSYALRGLTDPRDESVFLAALTIARVKAGWR